MVRTSEHVLIVSKLSHVHFHFFSALVVAKARFEHRDKKTMYTLKIKSTLVHLNVPYHFKAWFFSCCTVFCCCCCWYHVCVFAKESLDYFAFNGKIDSTVNCNHCKWIGIDQVLQNIVSSFVPKCTTEIEINLKSSNESDCCFLLLIGMIQSLSAKCAMCIELFRIILFAVCRSALHKCH